MNPTFYCFQTGNARTESTTTTYKFALPLLWFLWNQHKKDFPTSRMWRHFDMLVSRKLSQWKRTISSLSPTCGYQRLWQILFTRTWGSQCSPQIVRSSWRGLWTCCLGGKRCCSFRNSGTTGILIHCHRLTGAIPNLCRQQRWFLSRTQIVRDIWVRTFCRI